MPFTDTDLRRLKEDKKIRSDSGGYIDGKTIRALLARLEAAERICQYISQRKVYTPDVCFDGNPIPIKIIEVWRKAAGK